MLSMFVPQIILVLSRRIVRIFWLRVMFSNIFRIRLADFRNFIEFVKMEQLSISQFQKKQEQETNFVLEHHSLIWLRITMIHHLIEIWNISENIFIWAQLIKRHSKTQRNTYRKQQNHFTIMYSWNKMWLISSTGAILIFLFILRLSITNHFFRIILLISILLSLFDVTSRIS